MKQNCPVQDIRFSEHSEKNTKTGPAIKPDPFSLRREKLQFQHPDIVHDVDSDAYDSRNQNSGENAEMVRSKEEILNEIHSRDNDCSVKNQKQRRMIMLHGLSTSLLM